MSTKTHGGITIADDSQLRHQFVDDCLAFCVENDLRSVILAIPNSVSSTDVEALLTKNEIRGVVIQSGIEVANSLSVYVGSFVHQQYNWTLPKVKASTIAYLGPRGDISFRMVKKALLGGVYWLVYASPTKWRRELTIMFLVIRIYERLAFEIENRYRKIKNPALRSYHRMVHAMFRFRGSKLVVGILRRFERQLEPLNSFFERRSDQKFTAALDASCVPLLRPHEFVEGRIILVNASLASGGAERQVVNTLTGLKRRGYTDLTLLCEYLHDRPEHDFYFWQLQKEGITARKIRRHFDLPGDEIYASVAQLGDAKGSMPKNLNDDVLSFVIEFMESKPEVVHAWQDSTSIKAGYAAALVGVPKIILNGRNMAPYNFAYFLPYMRRGYAVLARHPAVTLVNNSRAGAADYEGWINLQSGSVKHLFNGLHSDSLGSVTDGECLEYRTRLGIPRDSKVVGSIFRFHEEKDPLLWIKTAALVAKKMPDVVFLLLGAGPLEDRIRKAAAARGLSDRLFLPGTEQRTELPLSVMDAFLLTSRLEGTPNVCIEAQWMGVPVVAPAVGGTADTVLNGETGWIVSPRSKHLLAEKVIQVLEDEDWSIEARRRGPEFAMGRFGFERMIDETITMYGLAQCDGRAVNEQSGTDELTLAAPESRPDRSEVTTNKLAGVGSAGELNGD